MSEKYDVIIIGAGIGGLVCGCYLAKAGMKVLIVEQHNKIGGYCSSFKRDEFIFEAGGIEGLNRNGILDRIIHELGLNDRVEIIRHDPSIIIATCDERIKIKNNIRETEYQLNERFPKEARAIESFFKFIDSYNIVYLYMRYREKTFDNLLDEYFHDERLKAIFRMMIAQIGVISSKISALSAISYMKSFIFDGGYYPKGGLQNFTDAFGNLFKEFGGKILLSNLVKKIIVNNDKADGIILSTGELINAKFIVSNADATQTFLELIGEKYLRNDFTSHITSLIPSISVFIVYLGIGKSLKNSIEPCRELWSFPNYKIADPFDEHRLDGDFKKINAYCYFTSLRDSSMAPKDSESISLSVHAPYLNWDYWSKNKIIFAEKLIDRFSTLVIGLKENIIKKEIAIPQTLYKYTRNRNGAFKGWAPFVSQIDISTMPPNTPIENLYLASHWVTMVSGESGVLQAAHVGERVSKIILKQYKMLI